MPLPPPEKASRSAEPLEPIETCTVSMPSMSEQRVLDLLRRGVLGLEARRGADVLGHREGVLAGVAEEVRLHERRDGDRADEHEHREAERDPRVP